MRLPMPSQAFYWTRQPMESTPRARQCCRSNGAHSMTTCPTLSPQRIPKTPRFPEGSLVAAGVGLDDVRHVANGLFGGRSERCLRSVNRVPNDREQRLHLFVSPLIPTIAQVSESVNRLEHLLGASVGKTLESVGRCLVLRYDFLCILTWHRLPLSS